MAVRDRSRACAATVRLTLPGAVQTMRRVSAAAFDSPTPGVRVEFAASLRRHVDCAAQELAPGSLRGLLEAALLAAPGLDRYVFDDQRDVRKHVAVFVNQQLVRDRHCLDQALSAGDRVFVAQALSGG